MEIPFQYIFPIYLSSSLFNSSILLSILSICSSNDKLVSVYLLSKLLFNFSINSSKFLSSIEVVSEPLTLNFCLNSSVMADKSFSGFSPLAIFLLLFLHPQIQYYY